MELLHASNVLLDALFVQQIQIMISFVIYVILLMDMNKITKLVETALLNLIQIFAHLTCAE